MFSKKVHGVPRYYSQTAPDGHRVRYEGPIDFFLSILLKSSSYGYSETTLSTKIFFSALGPFSVLKLKMTQSMILGILAPLSLST